MTSTPLRAIIVDDEALARAGLAADLASITAPAVKIVAQAANAYGALHVITAEKPDILFLDIEMPEINGFDLLAQLEPEVMPPAVIVVTAHNRHALQGFDANALDFLLKPYRPERLHTALLRAATRVQESIALRRALDAEVDASESTDVSPDQRVSNGRILVTRGGRTVVLNTADVEWIEAQSYYARVHAPPESYLVRERMSVLEASLDVATFFRTHRSAIVRLASIREIVAVSRYEFEVVLASGARAPLARTRRAALEAALSCAK